jgi:glutathione S-transferase
MAHITWIVCVATSARRHVSAEHAMITITALKWVPPFAQGQVRDFRVRWMLEEIELPYRVRLLDAEDQKGAAYRAMQPFGQVPVMEEDGAVIFETGAILLHLAERTGKLLPSDPRQRAQALSWLIAALNSVEPFIMNLVEMDVFEKDGEIKARRRPGVVATARRRLGEVEAALGDRDYLAGDFSIADMLMAGIVRMVPRDILADFPKLTGYRERCLSRPAFKRAVAAQKKDFEGHSAADMKWG